MMNYTARRTDRLSAADYRAKAQECLRQEHESFERCDTDGFLSQWANSQMASRYRALAQIAEDGWVWSTTAIFDLDGNLLHAELKDTQYGSAWLIHNSDGSISWFRESCAVNEARRIGNDAKKGYYVGTIQRAVVPLSDAGWKFDDDVAAVILDNGQ